MPKAHIARTEMSGEVSEGRPFNPWRIFCARLPHLIDEAESARFEAFALSNRTRRQPPNHRDFYVGASLLGVAPAQRATIDHAAYNTMPKKSSKNVCAEKRIGERLAKIARDTNEEWWAVGEVVMGDAQADKGTGNDPETLWPCGEMCWPGAMQDLPADSIIVTIRPDKHKAQVQTAGHLVAYYEALLSGETPSEPPLFYHTPQEWAETVDRFDFMYPEDMDPFASPENRALAVEASIMAIQGIKLYIVK